MGMEPFAKGYERSGEAGAQDDDQTSLLARWTVLASTDLQNGRERTGSLGARVREAGADRKEGRLKRFSMCQEQ